MAINSQAKKPVRAGGIRRTVETMLAGELKISQVTRAQLLSYELSGFQVVPYDMGDHREEKADAMRKWNEYVVDLCIGANQVSDSGE